MSRVTTASRGVRGVAPRRPMCSMSSISSFIVRISRTCAAMISPASSRARGSRMSARRAVVDGDRMVGDHRLHEVCVVDEALPAVHRDQPEREHRRGGALPVHHVAEQPIVRGGLPLRAGRGTPARREEGVDVVQVCLQRITERQIGRVMAERRER